MSLFPARTEAAKGTAQYLDVPLRAAFVTAADTTNGMRASFGRSCIAEQGAYYMVRAPHWRCTHDVPPNLEAPLEP